MAARRTTAGLSDSFSLIPQPQEPGHCGPTSLSSCLALLGKKADQRQIARAINKPFRTYTEGVNEFEIRAAARKYGIRTEFLTVVDRAQGERFAARLRRHSRRGLPAILLVDHFAHWVALLGYLDEKQQFIVMDPDDRHHAFNRWSQRTLLRHAWNDSRGGDEPSQYFAILTSRKDERPPKWHINEAFLKLCEAGSEQTADEMANDLIEMARRARSEPADEDPGPFLEQVLARYERVVVGSVEHWAAYSHRAVTPAGLRALYRAYAIIAATAGIRLARSAEHAAIVAQMTTVLTTYAWNRSL